MNTNQTPHSSTPNEISDGLVHIWCAPRFVWKNKSKLMQKTICSKLLAHCRRWNGQRKCGGALLKWNYDEWQKYVEYVCWPFNWPRKHKKYQLLSLFSHTCDIHVRERKTTPTRTAHYRFRIRTCVRASTHCLNVVRPDKWFSFFDLFKNL